MVFVKLIILILLVILDFPTIIFYSKVIDIIVFGIGISNIQKIKKFTMMWKIYSVFF